MAGYWRAHHGLRSTTVPVVAVDKTGAVVDVRDDATAGDCVNSRRVVSRCSRACTTRRTRHQVRKQALTAVRTDGRSRWRVVLGYSCPWQRETGTRRRRRIRCPRSRTSLGCAGATATLAVECRGFDVRRGV